MRPWRRRRLRAGAASGGRGGVGRVVEVGVVEVPNTGTTAPISIRPLAVGVRLVSSSPPTGRPSTFLYAAAALPDGAQDVGPELLRGVAPIAAPVPADQFEEVAPSSATALHMVCSRWRERRRRRRGRRGSGAARGRAGRGDDQQLANDVLAGDGVVAAAVPAAEPAPGARRWSPTCSGWRRPWGRRGSSTSRKYTGRERMASAASMPLEPSCRSVAGARATSAAPARGQQGGRRRRAWERRAPGRSRRAHSASTRDTRFSVRGPGSTRKPVFVGEQVLAVVLDAEVPADPAVPDGALQRRRREAGTSHSPRRCAAHYIVSPIFGSVPR